MKKITIIIATIIAITLTIIIRIRNTNHKSYNALCTNKQSGGDINK